MTTTVKTCVKRYACDLTNGGMFEIAHGAYVLASDHDATVAELRAELERVRGALRKYGDHFPECAVIQECGMAVKPPCNCGYAALTPQEPV